MKKWAKRIGLGALILVLVAVLGTFVSFEIWSHQHARDLEAQSTIVQIPRGPIEYAEVGHGAPVLFVHGTPGGYDQPLSSIKVAHKDQKGYRYILPSRPGYLRTPLAVGETPQQQALAFAELLTKLGIEKVAVVAASGGGPAALQFVLQFPERCTALVLEETITQRQAENPALLSASTFRDYLMWLFGGFQIAQWQAVNPSDRDIAIIGQSILASVVPSDLRKAGEGNDFKQFSQIENWPLNRIHCPTLILHGTADVNVPIAHAEYAHAQITGSEFVKLQGENHFMVITKHKELDDLIEAFIAKHVGT